MSVETNRLPAGVVIIGNEAFLIAADERGVPMWEPTRMPTQEGDPTVPRRKRWNDWSRGLGDSRGMFEGSVEYAENAYLGASGRILPGPKITTITTGLGADCVSIIEVDAPASRILAGGGAKVVAINAASDAVTLEHTAGAGSVLSLCRFDDQVAVALGDATDYAVRSNTGTYSTNSIGKKARCFGLVNGDLARGYGNKRSLCSAANITSVDNWSAELQIGKAEGNINQIFSHNRWEYVYKDEGLYSFDEDTSEEANLLTDLEGFPSSDNRAYFRWYDHVYLCTTSGLYRYIQQGAARTVGIEELEINESELANVRPSAGVAFGRIIIVAFTDGTSTWICMGRRAKEGDASFGSPVTFLSVIEKFTGLCKAMLFSAKSGSPRVYYAAGADLHYFTVTRDGRPATYRDSGSVTVWFPPTDFDSPATMKNFRGLEVIGRNAHANRAIQMKAKVDGGASANVGSAITAFTATYAEAFWTLASGDTGRVLQVGLTMACNDTATAPEVRDVFVNFEERPIMVPAWNLGLLFRDFFNQGEVSSRLSAEEQRDAIEDLLEAAPVTVIDPAGRSFTGRLVRATGKVGFQYRGEQPQCDMVIGVRELEYA